MSVILNSTAANPHPAERPHSSARPAGWREALAAVGLVVAFIWPALFNGQPFFFPDTTTYIRGADAGIQAAFNHKSAWSEQAEGPKSVSSIADKTVLTGRSPYYGTLLYLGDLSGGFWLSVIVQAAAVLAAIGLALRATQVPLWPRGFVIGLGVAAISTAPFFSSLLMPDVFAGVAILTAALLLAVRQRWTGGDYATAFVLLAAAAAFHDSHGLILIILVVLGAAHALLTRSWTAWRGLVLIAAALVVGILAQSAFYATVRHVVGVTPLRPPFLMARTIEDGPGYRYLRATCPANGFKVCDYADRLPMMADDFLWKQGPTGVFADAPPETRRQLSNEQLSFMRAVVAYDPWGQLSASLKDAALQLIEMDLTEFQYTDLEKQGFAVKVPGEHLKTLQASAAARGTMPLGVLNAVMQTGVIIGALVVAWALLWRRSREALSSGAGSPLVPLMVWLAIGIVVNAAVCGVLSGPHDRYAARVAWLVPFAALLIVERLLSRLGGAGRPTGATPGPAAGSN